MWFDKHIHILHSIKSKTHQVLYLSLSAAMHTFTACTVADDSAVPAELGMQLKRVYRP